jgi:signal transduction histidine kinase
VLLEPEFRASASQMAARLPEVSNFVALLTWMPAAIDDGDEDSSRRAAREDASQLAEATTLVSAAASELSALELAPGNVGASGAANDGSGIEALATHIQELAAIVHALAPSVGRDELETRIHELAARVLLRQPPG